LTFSFIEIGTSDFEVAAEDFFKKLKENNQPFIGLSIEPLSIYFKKLPNPTDFYFKEQCAISNSEGTSQVYYIHPDIIKKFNGPWWWRGCNSLNEYHPVHIKASKRFHIPLEELVIKEVIKQKKIKTIIEKYNVEAIKFLKIDTEGHDLIILEDFLYYIQVSRQFNLLPKRIKFETKGSQKFKSTSKCLNDYDRITHTIEMFKDVGYKYLYPSNSSLTLN
jgi:hypothetical protein